MKLIKLVAITLSAALLHCPAEAKMVNLTGSGTLSSAFGAYSAGDPFSFSTSYDTASTGFVDGNTGFYDPASFFDFKVKGVSFSNEVIYYTIYDADDGSFHIGGVADSNPKGGIDIFTGRNDPTNLSLPTGMELNKKPGTFNFFAPTQFDEEENDLGGGGSGRFITIASPAPEPATWTTMLIGFALIGFLIRRRQRDLRTLAMATNASSLSRDWPRLPSTSLAGHPARRSMVSPAGFEPATY